MELLISQALNNKCQEAQEGNTSAVVQVQQKCFHQPFKLFGTTIPLPDPSASINVSDIETNNEPSRAPDDQDGQGLSLDNSDGESQASKKAKKNHAEEAETSESTNGKKSSSSNTTEKVMPKKPDKLVPCPRCDSMETKFCYYNNYNVNQPRHFCKNCQRYWTAGGTLRNVPVGAGRRKNKHNSTANNNTSTSLSSHSSIHSMTSCFSSLPIPVQNELTSSIISFGLDQDHTPTFSNVPYGSSIKRSSKLAAHMEILHETKPKETFGNWWMNKTKPSTTNSNTPSPWPSYVETALWGSSVLGKHARSNHREETNIMIPTTLRIYDSIWENVRPETKSDSSKSIGVFNEFQSQTNERVDSKQICSNSFKIQSINVSPAPPTRSMSYQEST